eukprot:COSAG04_NODE_24536_length_320_cov_0.927602_1_plen_71_part_10
MAHSLTTMLLNKGVRMIGAAADAAAQVGPPPAGPPPGRISKMLDRAKDALWKRFVKLIGGQHRIWPPSRQS